MKRYLTLAAVAAILIFGGCAKESKFPNASGKGSIRAINAIPRSPDFLFLIEERLLGTVRFQAASDGAQYDDLEYNFNFDTVLAGDTQATRVATQLLDVAKDTIYTYVISGDFTSPDITLWEMPRREWSEADTLFEVRAAHLATTQGLLDVYLTDGVTPPQLGSQIATIGLGDVGPAVDLTSGDYVLTVTPAGDDSTILFQSDLLVLGAQSQVVISIFDPDRNDTGSISPLFMNQTTGSSGELADARFPPSMRFVHASMTLGNADIYTDDPLTVPIVTDHAFMEITDFYDVPRTSIPITYTAPGDTGTILFDVDEFIPQGAKAEYYVLPRDSGDDFTVGFVADRRAVDTRARFGLINAAAGRDAVDIYLVQSGELIDEATPFITQIPLSEGPFDFPVTPGSYDIYVTDIDEKVPLAGPIPFTPDFGDYFQAIIFENVQPTVVDFAFIPQP